MGEKRLCLECGAKFYDLCHDPIICPKCKTRFIPPALPEAETDALDDSVGSRDTNDVSLDAIITEDDLDTEDEDTLSGDDVQDDAFVEEEEEELSDFIRSGDMNDEDEV
jgi:uncharacterized protein (TIGR02300 family)